MYRLCANHDPQPPIFDQYWQTISQLADTEHREAALRRFEWSLFEQLGHPFPWFQLDATDADTVMFEPASGYMTCGPDHPQGLLMHHTSNIAATRKPLLSPEVIIPNNLMSIFRR